MNPFIQFYLANLAPLAGLLAGIGVIYVAVLGGLGWLVRSRQGKALFRALWPSIAIGVFIAAVAVSVFIAIAGLYRFERPDAILVGALSFYRQDWEVYASAAGVAFYVLYGLLVVLSGLIGYLRARTIGHGIAGAIAAAFFVLLYLMMSLPLVDFFNACVIGKPFLLPVGC